MELVHTYNPQLFKERIELYHEVIHNKTSQHLIVCAKYTNIYPRKTIV